MAYISGFTSLEALLSRLVATDLCLVFSGDTTTDDMLLLITEADDLLQVCGGQKMKAAVSKYETLLALYRSLETNTIV